MSDQMSPGDRNQLAAEYALGLLEGEALGRARTMANADPGFAEEVARWAGRLAPLLDEVQPVPPPEHLLAGIERRIGARHANDNVRSLRRRLNLWRGFAAGASAIAASLAVVLLSDRPALEPVPAVGSPTPPMVATMAGEGAGPRLVATWHPDDNSLVVAAAVAGASDPGHSHELWVIPADGTPRSIGVMPAGAAMHANVPAVLAQQLAEGATLAVSVEPIGGSPTGLPTGPVIASGKLQRA